MSRIDQLRSPTRRKVACSSLSLLGDPSPRLAQWAQRASSRRRRSSSACRSAIPPGWPRHRARSEAPSPPVEPGAHRDVASEIRTSRCAPVLFATTIHSHPREERTVREAKAPGRHAARRRPSPAEARSCATRPTNGHRHHFRSSADERAIPHRAATARAKAFFTMPRSPGDGKAGDEALSESASRRAACVTCPTAVVVRFGMMGPQERVSPPPRKDGAARATGSSW